MKVIADYDYIYNVIDYDYIASKNGNYVCDYLRSCNRSQSIMITDYPMPDIYIFIAALKSVVINLPCDP